MLKKILISTLIGAMPISSQFALSSHQNTNLKDDAHWKYVSINPYKYHNSCGGIIDEVHTYYDEMRPRLLFDWTKYASTWDEFITNYTYISWSGGSDTCQGTLLSLDYDYSSAQAETSGIGKINWDDLIKTTSDCTFDLNTGIKTSGFAQGEITASFRLVRDTKYVYIQNQEHMYTEASATATTVDINLSDDFFICNYQ